ncbi:hypothetical protein SAMN02746065_10673 [Desulfocicer vacuolatum DSM 3385]|uniref:Uncharacterized protein n=1 Tax=Desulfocicer vacuolatum DSM 3385 TaxID=1121400 RepID=A0A1W2AU64_9BACT|nr:hypothetical protein [Desulfocicer vacuolatum]SMC63748.1 hypothetical protein SAMN02746065_10673 [Desulfocicer vacuolatum DSM 3385]
MPKNTIFFLLFIAINIWSPLVNASFVTSPLRLDFKIKPGETATQHITITSIGNSPITVKTFIKDFKINPNGKDIELSPGEVNRSCSSWIALQKEFELNPGDKNQARVTISVPKNASGSYWCDVFATQTCDPKPRTLKKGEVQMVIGIIQRWKVRVHVDVPVNNVNNGGITDMQIIPASQDKSPSINVEFDNTGNTILRCSGRIELKNEEGETIREIPLGKNKKFTVYPESKKNILTQITEKISPGNYVALAVIDYDGDNLIAGELEFEVR